MEEVVPLIHDELYKIARRYMYREARGHTLQATALVNEAFIRLIGWKNAEWENRRHFYGVAATIMRRILVDFARKAARVDGERLLKVSVAHAEETSGQDDPEIVALDEALNSLAEFDERKARIVELRFFGGLTVEETSEVVGVAPITVMREWKKARAWLYLQLNKTD